MSHELIGIIGGSGLYQMKGVELLEERVVDTPFGSPSDALMFGKLNGADVVFLPRHGRGHRVLPHELNFRANIFALKELGVHQIISVSAVGSMKEEIKPGHLVMADQFIDRTKMREQTFFGHGIAAHTSFADPVCSRLRSQLATAAREKKITVHDRGTYVCIEGPMFSSRAESNVYRSWGVDVIGMTNYQEAKLAREAEMCYATIALVTDYDCWRAETADVDIPEIVRILKDNVSKAESVIASLVPTLQDDASCPCHHALQHAIMTDPKMIPDKLKRDLGPIIGKYIG